MSKEDIKKTPVRNDIVPQSVYNTVGRQAFEDLKAKPDKSENKK